MNIITLPVVLLSCTFTIRIITLMSQDFCPTHADSLIHDTLAIEFTSFL